MFVKGYGSVVVGGLGVARGVRGGGRRGGARGRVGLGVRGHALLRVALLRLRVRAALAARALRKVNQD